MAAAANFTMLKPALGRYIYIDVLKFRGVTWPTVKRYGWWW